jgi:hypothetical protein
VFFGHLHDVLGVPDCLKGRDLCTEFDFEKV